MNNLFSLCLGLAAVFLPILATAQVNSGSNGSDGAFNPTTSVEIDMADHPDGIYQYTSVNIPSGVQVRFKPNAANKPVIWLVQGNATIIGQVEVSGLYQDGSLAGIGGPGGWSGGGGGEQPKIGEGPGGGQPKTATSSYGGNGSYATQGSFQNGVGAGAAGQTYGNSFLIPLIGGSGGGAGSDSGGGGGGGAILIAASAGVTVNGQIRAYGSQPGFAPYKGYVGGGGSGGAIRIVTNMFSGSGSLGASGGQGSYGPGIGGLGRIRLDIYENKFAGGLDGVFTQGFQPIILPAAGQGIQLNIASVGGSAISSPNGVLANPDVIISAQKTNPIPVVVNCSNIPLGTEISVKVHPANGADVTAVGLNNSGTLAASTATVQVNMPRGGGIIYASAVTGIAGTASLDSHEADNIANADEQTKPAVPAKARSLAETGWTADGERFKAIEVTASLGGKQRVAYISESGKRYPLN